MSGLLTLGLSDRTAPDAVRDRLLLAPERRLPLLNRLVGTATITEAVVVATSTCTEVYVAAADETAAETAALGALAAEAGMAPTTLLDHCYALRGSHAIRHLFTLVSGLDATVPGEEELLADVRRGYDDALAAGLTGPLTNRLFSAALAAGKKVRTETGIERCGVTIDAVAVEIAQSALGDLSRRRMLVIGDGSDGELAAQGLAAAGVRVAFLGGRRAARGAGCGVVVGIGELANELWRSDIVVAAGATADTIVTAELLEPVVPRRRGRRLVLLDTAVPRQIDPGVRALAGVTLFDRGDLERRIARNVRQRRGELKPAQTIVEEELGRFEEWLCAIDTLPAVRELRARGEQIVQQVLAENDEHWEGLSEADRERVRTLARSVMRRLLHEPTRRVKDRSIDPSLARDLFGL
jgi:glutamyl-tRNA reductase